jgi:protoheme IX farnesyltransferase
VAGRAATTRQILIYSVVLLPISLLPWGFGFAGPIYGLAAAICGVILVGLAWQLDRSRHADRGAAHRLFGFSILYLFVLFAALLAGSGNDRWPSKFSLRDALTDVGAAQADPLPRPVRAAASAIRVRTDEV